MDATLDVDTPLPLSLRMARIEDAALGIRVIAVQRHAQGQGGWVSRIDAARIVDTRSAPRLANACALGLKMVCVSRARSSALGLDR